ncbi:partner and localizer of BRCA2 isoform X2 [Eleutherodactylus coqui]|uniref:partner and localizer of BRCA2 isoform X2 n=1 Tax=Eleutherodactylus coqui TaxID=57060 RepID=UPI003461EA66
MAAARDMESAPETHLTSEEKAKLKERLALLKKEYRKTVHRLERSQRAERVKTHIKKTIEEQNRLLSQDLSQQGSVSVLTGPLSATNNASGEIPESAQSVNTLSTDKERKPSVSFNLDPEILSGHKRSPSRSGSESSSQEPSAASKTERSRPPDPNQCKRSRLRLNRSAKRSCPDSIQVYSIVNSLEGPHSIKEAESSTRCSSRCLMEEALKITETAYDSVSENTRRIQESNERRNGLGVNDLVKQCNNVETSNTPSSPLFKKCLKEAVPTSVKPPSEYIECIYPEEKTITLDTGQSQEVATGHSQDRSTYNTVQTGKEPAHCNRNHRHQNLSGDPLPSITQVIGGTPQDLTSDATLDPPSIPQVVKSSSKSTSCPENPSVETVKQHGEPSAMEEQRSPLESCTLVDGLLFPVEYYIRTTRRMTSFQRKVDLEAVINSHLGTGRKGARGRPRRVSTPSASSLQASSTPLCTSTHSTTKPRRGRPKKTSPASGSSSLNNIAKQLEFSSDMSPIAGGSRDGTGACEKKELNNETCVENPQMKEDLKKVEAVSLPSEGRKVNSLRKLHDGHLGISASTSDTEKFQRHFYNLRTSTEMSKPGLTFHLFSGGHKSQNLLHHLDITDFHLPDEDFGVLKLEKLKSISHLETFDPKLTNESLHSIDNSAHPAGDSSALLHGAAEAYTDTSQKMPKLTPSKCCPDDGPFLDRDQATLGDDVPASPQDQTFPTRETSEEFHLLLSKENDETHVPRSPVNHSFTQAQSDALQWEHTDSGAEASKLVPPASVGLPDPEPSHIVETLREGFLSSSTTVGSVETKSPPNVLSPTEEVTSSGLLSISMCSAPLDTQAEYVSSGCTPGFPMLGSTPAIFSSPHGNYPTPCHQQTFRRAMGCLPDEMKNEVKMATQDKTCTEQYSESLLPPSGDVTPAACAKKKPSSHQEHEANVNRSDQCNTKGDRLRFVSEIKDACGGGCLVDLCSVWWESSGGMDLCIVSASEYSICLWRPQDVCEWRCVHTWNFTELSVIQILPLFQEKNMVCVALGNLEIIEIWVLSLHPELHTWEKQLVKRGHTRTAQGLSWHRVVCSSGGRDSQVVELWQLSADGSVTGSHTLVAPKDSVVAFSEVDGEREALVGFTVDNNLVLWNSVTGHLLSTFYIGNHCSDLTRISATSDSGVLFLVVGSLFSKPCEITGSCIFKLIATNPQGGASAFIMAYTIPEGLGNRYLEGDVKKEGAAAVLSCGSIVLWDLSRSHCSAVLPADSDRPWCLVRWGNRDSCLLAGRNDGTICVFEYTD